jgi:transcriptional regulator
MSRELSCETKSVYNPSAFREARPEILAAALAAHPLAALVTMGSQGLDASHIPLIYHPTEGGTGVLRGHMARANPQWQQYTQGTEALAIFSGPQHYVTPAWYPSKQEHGKVVPTWNYLVVHARGPLSFQQEPTWLLENVQSLTDTHESSRNAPWHVMDAPSDYIDNMLSAIVGLEMKIARLEGKWKVSQNRPEFDRVGVVDGLRQEGGEEAAAMAELVRQPGGGRREKSSIVTSERPERGDQ